MWSLLNVSRLQRVRDVYSEYKSTNFTGMDANKDMYGSTSVVCAKICNFPNWNFQRTTLFPVFNSFHFLDKFAPLLVETSKPKPCFIAPVQKCLWNGSINQKVLVKLTTTEKQSVEREVLIVALRCWFALSSKTDQQYHHDYYELFQLREQRITHTKFQTSYAIATSPNTHTHTAIVQKLWLLLRIIIIFGQLRRIYSFTAYKK